ncbi:dehydrin DHN1-like [Prosopis cineraria]|uniref:dehydrin DHN1-like n=1 Tax=Prosopis cineraria TaxID=364024 RepID=UPI0024106B27|nr:dehydrin DHN1-like [Prosopis cineraria]
MAHYQKHQYGDARWTDEYGKPVNYYDKRSGTTGYGGAGVTGTDHLRESSSSSEDEVVDENGVRRKKGMKEKIKEKIPGVGGHSAHAHQTSTTTPGGAGSSEDHHHKKGFMDKVKEKLHGHN